MFMIAVLGRQDMWVPRTYISADLIYFASVWFWRVVVYKNRSICAHTQRNLVRIREKAQ